MKLERSWLDQAEFQKLNYELFLTPLTIRFRAPSRMLSQHMKEEKIILKGSGMECSLL